MSQDTSVSATLPGKISIAGSDTLSNMVESWAGVLVKKTQVQFQLQASGSASTPIALRGYCLGYHGRKMTRRERQRFIDFYGYPPMK